MSGQAEKEAGAKKKPIPIIAGAVILVIAAMFLMRGMGSKADSKKEKKEAVEVGISVPLEEFLVNLSGGGDHYLRATIALGLVKGKTEEQAEHHLAPIRDTILSTLSEQTLKQLHETKGKERLKKELQEKINEAAGEELVAKVYFTAFATQ